MNLWLEPACMSQICESVGCDKKKHFLSSTFSTLKSGELVSQSTQDFGDDLDISCAGFCIPLPVRRGRLPL